MAESDNGIISAIAQLVEKFVGDYSIWLWLVVFGLTVLIIDKYNIISISDLSTDRHSMAIVGLIFAFCLFLNAVRLQIYAFNLIRSTFALLVSTIEARRLKSEKDAYIAAKYDKNRKAFKEIMYIDCKERTWILWFIFVYKPRTKKRYFIYNEVHGTNGGFILWRDEIAERLVRIYGVMEFTDKNTSYELIYSSDSLITESFDFEIYLKELTSIDAELKSQLKIERDSILSLLPAETKYNTYGDALQDTKIFLESKKPFFFQASQNCASQNPTPIVESDLLS
jgi:hypothetical protein